MLASKRNGTHIGMTDDLLKRVWMHREDILPGFERLWRETPRLVRGPRVAGIRAPARAANEKMESRLENSSDRSRQSELARP
jgi:hypothetical protein